MELIIEIIEDFKKDFIIKSKNPRFNIQKFIKDTQFKINKKIYDYLDDEWQLLDKEFRNFSEVIKEIKKIFPNGFDIKEDPIPGNIRKTLSDKGIDYGILYPKDMQDLKEKFDTYKFWEDYIIFREKAKCRDIPKELWAQLYEKYPDICEGDNFRFFD
jgi:hypothetical protein